ncbi:MAG: hypothetical protein JWP88_832 [Flaviaesturariibacter sp.]|nr:hypothetical protein [Flaviaesturariibacter sp.]
MKRRFLPLLYLLALSLTSTAQRIGDIHTAKLYRAGDQASFPVLTLAGGDALELHFDDLEGDIKNYYYGFQLCNADWTPSVLRTFEYVRGFQSVRITNYRNSSLSSVRYTHYQAQVPDRNCVPTHSGNYLLKVFLNADTTQLAFEKRFVVVDNKTSVAAQLQQPFNAQYFRTHQKLNIAVTTDNKINVMSPQDLKVVIVQNNSWRTSLLLDRPTIYRGNYYEYSDEAYTALPAGKEWRWLDMRSLRLMSDRMERINSRKDTTEVFVKSEASRNGQIYVYYRDLNGSYSIETLESLNPFWQGDYGKVHFSYTPPGGKAFEGRDMYVFGELTDYADAGKGMMTFNPDKGAYEADLLLKQGYYNYNYVTLPLDGAGFPDFSGTEGNYWATENSYTVLIYYRPFGARADELIGYAGVNSSFQR